MRSRPPTGAAGPGAARPPSTPSCARVLSPLAISAGNGAAPGSRAVITAVLGREDRLLAVLEASRRRRIASWRRRRRFRAAESRSAAEFDGSLRRQCRVPALQRISRRTAK
ncbi:hypothetical protein DB32_005430 [Sandaracinus amylolyticus]|uniref:Uncharacterized protein n=1 Tax=Sandaracinus amylolyticus TaxID=927083 RepID=A0A0F6W5V7_9BACT|nr:hypothetical protein DB32_005430 [Sandaracinus amylolyticus]